jgi:hypothetical protein
MEPQRLDTNEAIAWRLKCLRYAVSRDNQSHFAAHLGIEPKRWNNLERGYPLSKDVALKIVQRWPDLTLDWLFRGRDEHLEVWRQREIIDAGKALTSPAGRGAKTRVG